MMDSPRYLRQREQDALAIVRQIGPPDVFITLTMDPKHPDVLAAYDKFNVRDDTDSASIVARVFELQKKKLMQLLIKQDVFGQVVAHVHCIEFQFRGTPHMHLLLFLNDSNEPKCAADYNRFCTVAIPGDSQPELRELVLKYHVHGPCGHFNPKARCMNDGECRFGYPKSYCPETYNRSHDGRPMMHRRSPNDGGGTGQVTRGRKTIAVTEEWTSEYNPFLLMMFRCHINVAPCGVMQNMAYLFRYITKTGGFDKTSMNLLSKHHVDEIQQYTNARVLTPPASAYIIHGFSKYELQPSVIKLPTLLEDQQTVLYNPDDRSATEAVMNHRKVTKFTAWFALCAAEETDDGKYEVSAVYPPGTAAKDLLYRELPRYYTWYAQKQLWKRRVRQLPRFNTIGRIYSVNPVAVERYHQLMILNYAQPKMLRRSSYCRWCGLRHIP